MAQLGQLGGVGEARRAREQAAIDLAQGQFQQELMFPEETLATYLRFITNAPAPSGFQQTRQTPTVPGPSSLQQLAGLGISGAAAGKAFGLFNRGGAIGRQAGLSGIVRRAGGGQIVRMQDGGGIFDRIANYKGIGNFLPSTSELYEGFKQSPFAQDVIAPAGQFLSGTLSDVYDIAGEGVEYLTGIKTPSATEAYMNLGLSREEAAAMAGEGKGAVSRTLGDPKSLVREGSTRMSDLVLPDGFDVGDYEETVAYKSAPKPKPKPETTREEVDKIVDNLNRRSEDKPRLDDAAYLDIAAAALKGAYEPGTVDRPTGVVESLGKVLSPAASAAAAGMRETKKTQREEEALEMARRKEDRETTSAQFIDDLRKAKTVYETARPGIEKDKARSDFIRGVSSLFNQQVITEEQAMELLAPILGTTSSAGGGSQSDDNLATGDPNKLR